MTDGYNCGCGRTYRHDHDVATGGLIPWANPEPTSHLCPRCEPMAEHAKRMEARAVRAEEVLASARDLSEQRRLKIVELEKRLTDLVLTLAEA